MQKLLIPIVSLVYLSVIGCSGCAYKLDVQQGNIVEQEDLNAIKPNMTKRQVRYLLGTPLVHDPFHQQRWDYYSSFQPGGGDREQRRVSLFFQEDRLIRIEGDMRPQPTAEADPKPQTTVVTVEHAARENQGVLDRLLGGIGIGDDE